MNGIFRFYQNFNLIEDLTIEFHRIFKIYRKEPYANDIIAVELIENVELLDAIEFDCHRIAKRHPREAKGLEYNLTALLGAEDCEPEGNCC